MFKPPKAWLENYSRVLVDFALNGGLGLRSGETVYLVTQLPGLPLAREVGRRILRRGGHVLLRILDDEFQKIEYETATLRQLSWFPAKAMKGLADQIDHWIRILAYEDPLIFRRIDPRRILASNTAMRPFREWLDAKEDRGRFSWTLGLYGTAAKARLAGLSERAYWEQIARACFLDDPDPVGRWRKVFDDIHGLVRTLDGLDIAELRVRAPHTDLTVRLGERRRWLGGSGRNIPSFEIFTSPDWRGTEGTVRFDLPLYRYGQLLRDIRLEFRSGRVVRASAGTNERLLRSMLRQPNADKIGEFSLTDRRFSRITRFMADSLYDENHGGTHGNMHLALGRAYHEAYRGNPSRLSAEDWQTLGFNDSPEHTDLIATTPRTVTARLRKGGERKIYEDGVFLL